MPLVHRNTSEFQQMQPHREISTSMKDDHRVVLGFPILIIPTRMSTLGKKRRGKLERLYQQVKIQSDVTDTFRTKAVLIEISLLS